MSSDGKTSGDIADELSEKSCKFTVKMSAPVGPKTADIVMNHKFKKFEQKGIIVNEVEHKTLNFPYADYFDIIHR